MFQLIAMRTVIEKLLEITHRLAPGDLDQVLLTARSLHLERRDHPTGDPFADLLPELMLEILETGFGDPEENLTTPY